MITTAILTISDKGSKGERVDITGVELKKIIEAKEYRVEYYEIIPDEIKVIEEKLCYLSDTLKVNLILTNGGTGFSKRDVTPEATKNIIQKYIPGIGEFMRSNSFKITKKAILSRGIAGIRNESVIINLPGSPKGAVENFEALIDIIPHGLQILLGECFECARE